MHCVFHGIRFKVNNEDWLSVMDGLFFLKQILENPCLIAINEKNGYEQDSILYWGIGFVVDG